METCKYGSVAGITRPTAERQQGVICQACVYCNGRVTCQGASITV